jgi:hypothetical protein
MISSFYSRTGLVLIVWLFYILCASGCSGSSSNSGGTTGGNPMQSSLPLQVSMDVK